MKISNKYFDWYFTGEGQFTFVPKEDLLKEMDTEELKRFVSCIRSANEYLVE